MSGVNGVAVFEVGKLMVSLNNDCLFLFVQRELIYFRKTAMGMEMGPVILAAVKSTAQATLQKQQI
jgi:hypothetical protein